MKLKITQKGRLFGLRPPPAYHSTYRSLKVLLKNDQLSITSQQWNTHLFCKGKNHSIAGLLFDGFGFSSSVTNKQQHIFYFGRFQSSQSGDQLFSVTSPYGECFLPHPIIKKLKSFNIQSYLQQIKHVIQFATRGHCIKSKKCHTITVRNNKISLCSKRASLFSFFAQPSSGKLKGQLCKNRNLVQRIGPY